MSIIVLLFQLSVLQFKTKILERNNKFPTSNVYIVSQDRAQKLLTFVSLLSHRIESHSLFIFCTLVIYTVMSKSSTLYTQVIFKKAENFLFIRFRILLTGQLLLFMQALNFQISAHFLHPLLF